MTIRPEFYRRGFALILVLIVGILLIGLSAFVFGLRKFSPKSVITNVLAKPSPSPAIKTYETQEECESATGKSCTILMCDVVPEGKTFEETCGVGFKTGWAPTRLNNNLQPSQSNETTNWKTYTSKDGKYSLEYPPDWYLQDNSQFEDLGNGEKTFLTHIEISKNNHVLRTLQPLAMGSGVCVYPDSSVEDKQNDGTYPYTIIVDYVEIKSTNSTFRRNKVTNENIPDGYKDKIYWAVCEKRNNVTTFSQEAGFGMTHLVTPKQTDPQLLKKLDQILSTFKFLEIN